MAADTPARLAPADLDKLAVIVVLLSSDKPGEIVAAEADAQRFLARHGLTSPELVAAPSLPARTGTFDVVPDWPMSWRSAFYRRQGAPPQCLAQRQFVANLSKYKYEPSGPQLDLVATIVGSAIAKGDAQ